MKDVVDQLTVVFTNLQRSEMWDEASSIRTFLDGRDKGHAASLAKAESKLEEFRKKYPDALPEDIPTTRQLISHLQLLIEGCQDRRQRNFIEIQAEQVEPYLSRRTLPLEPGQGEACLDTGYVVVRYRGIALGTGLQCPSPFMMKSKNLDERS